MVAALLSTIPWQVQKSSTDGSVVRINITSSKRLEYTEMLYLTFQTIQWCVLFWNKIAMRIYSIQTTTLNKTICYTIKSLYHTSRYLTRYDSDLEAFNLNRTDGSFVPLVGRPSTWTKCLDLQFLSYWAGLLS